MHPHVCLQAWSCWRRVLPHRVHGPATHSCAAKNVPPTCRSELLVDSSTSQCSAFTPITLQRREGGRGHAQGSWLGGGPRLASTRQASGGLQHGAPARQPFEPPPTPHAPLTAR